MIVNVLKLVGCTLGAGIASFVASIALFQLFSKDNDNNPEKAVHGLFVVGPITLLGLGIGFGYGIGL